MNKQPTKVTKTEIIDGLRRIGLEPGDHVLAHCALTSFGNVTGGADTVIDALLDIVGPDGTVLVPTFGGADDAFDAHKTETNLGLIPKTFWKRKGAIRSRHPLASIAAIGPKAEWFARDHEKAATAHGKGTPYHKLYETGGKVLLLGVDQDRSTFLHTAETLAQLPYLRPNTASYIDEHGKKQTKTWPWFPGPHRDFIGLQEWLEDEGLTSKTVIGNCVAQLLPCKPLLDALLNRLEDEPNLFISGNPYLHAGIWQTADILRKHWRRLPFTTAADTRFAGMYTEEIIDNLALAGIDHLVLSHINSVPWQHLEKKKRKWILQGFRQAKIQIAAIRVPVLSEEDPGILLDEARCDTLIVPPTSDLAPIVHLARRGYNILLENVRVTSEQLVDIFEHMPKREAARVKLAYDPLAFVEVGENPFLTSYKTRIRRHIGLLYVNDGLADGQRMPLENGLCEIKELLSILYSKSFDGIIAVQADNMSGFPATIDQLMNMLKETGVWPRA